MSVHDIIGANCKQLRERRSLTVDKLAQASGVARSIIYGIEDGAPTSMRTVEALAQGLGVDPERLLKPPRSDVRRL